MRWFVEITSFGQNPAPPVTFCVEAPQWQPALQKTRALRGDTGALSNFSIELLEDGYKAIDPTARVRYMISKAPDDAPLSEEGGAQPAPAPVHAMLAKAARAGTLVFGSSGLAAIRDEAVAAAASAPVAAPAPVPAPASAPPIPIPAAPVAPIPISVAPDPTDISAPLPPCELVASRDDNPSERTPLTYRERVYAVPEGTPEEAAKAILIRRFDEIRALLADDFSGKLINLAVFDHVFRGKPQRRPIATLAWKDWKSAEPDIRFPAREATGEPPPSGEAPTQSSAPPPGSNPPAAPSSPSSPPPSGTPSSSPISRGAPSSSPVSRAVPASAPPPVSSARVTPSSKPPLTPPPPKRLTGEDLIAELFDACGDLQFLNDPLDGADFILALAVEKIPSEIGLVSFFDSARREFVVVRQLGGENQVILTRFSEFAALPRAAMRASRAVVVPDAPADPRVSADERWKAIGVSPKSLLCAPVQAVGRSLGLVEVVNPLDGGRFSEDDGNALTYIGQQLAQFLDAREVIVDRERVMKDAQKGPRR